MRPRTGLAAHADFMRLWSAQAVSAIGSRITRTALPIIAITTLGQPETVIALLSATYLVPGLVLALFTGGLVDRGRKRPILIGADVVRGVAVASIPLASWLDVLDAWHLIGVAAVVGAASAVFQIADTAYLPSLIGTLPLAEGNSRLEATEGIAEVTGPALAGLLIGTFGGPLAVALDAASYAWSAVLLGRIRAAEPPPLAGAHRWQVRHDLRDGLRAVLRHDLVRPVVRALVVWSVAGGFFTALYTLFCLRTLGLSASTYGVIVAVGGVGSLCGALLSRRLVARLGLGPSLIACATISLVGLLLIPLASGPRWLVLTLLAAHQLISDGFSVAFVIQAVTLRQTALPKDVLGRANAAVHVATGGLVPVAALAAGALAELTSIRTAVWVGVLIGLVAPLCLLPLRHVRALPSATSPTDQTQASAG